MFNKVLGMFKKNNDQVRKDLETRLNIIGENIHQVFSNQQVTIFEAADVLASLVQENDHQIAVYIKKIEVENNKLRGENKDLQESYDRIKSEPSSGEENPQ